MNDTKHYTDSLHYELIHTTKYLRMFGVQVFEEECIEMTPDEFSTLDVISCNPNICQRDLAKLILKDRANTGRLLDALEEKGYITRTLVERNNRPIKQINITENGSKFLKETIEYLKERFDALNNIITDEEIERTRECLKKIRTVLADIIHTQI